MASDDFGRGRMPAGGGGPARRPIQSAQSQPLYGEPSDVARQIGRLEARLKSIADGAPLPAGDRAVDAAIDDAVARLASDLRKNSGIAPPAKGRLDFRMSAARRDHPLEPGHAPALQALSAPSAGQSYSSAETVESQFEAIRQRMSELAYEPASANVTLDRAEAPEIDDVLPLAGADYLDVVERMEGLAQAVPDRNRIERLAESVARLGDVMAGSGHLSALASIESRIGRLAEEMRALSERPATDAELHARLADIRSLVIAANAADKGVARLESQFAAIAERIEAALARVPRADAIVAIANRLDAVTGRLDQIGANLSRPAPALEALAREMALLRREVTDGTNRLDPAALDAQFAALAKRFDAMARVGGGGAAVGHLEAQVQRLSEKIEEGFARRAPAAAAQPEARGPARATTTTGPKASDNPMADALKDDLSRLSGAQQAAPAPANPAAAAATLNAAMESFVRRLATMEGEARQKAAQATAQPARQHSREAEVGDDRRPLEPGSGRPGRAEPRGPQDGVRCRRPPRSTGGRRGITLWRALRAARTTKAGDSCTLRRGRAPAAARLSGGGGRHRPHRGRIAANHQHVAARDQRQFRGDRRHGRNACHNSGHCRGLRHCRPRDRYHHDGERRNSDLRRGRSVHPATTPARRVRLTASFWASKARITFHRRRNRPRRSRFRIRRTYRRSPFPTPRLPIPAAGRRLA